MKLHFCFSFALGIFSLGMVLGLKAQVDTIYFGQKSYANRNKIVPCNIKSLSNPELVYIDPATGFQSKVHLNDIRKVRFKSGAVKYFSNDDGIVKDVNNADDWGNVLIMSHETASEGLLKIKDIIIIGNDGYDLAKDRAYNKLKMETAMLGGNVVQIISEKDGRKSLNGNSTIGETILTGTVYSKVLPNPDKFNASIGDKKKFKVTEKFMLPMDGRKGDLKTEKVDHWLEVKKTSMEGESIFLEGEIGPHKGRFRVTHVEANYFILFYSNKMDDFKYNANKENFFTENDETHYNFVVSF